jgi:hypothetical protein
MYSIIPIHCNINLLQPAQAGVVLGQLSTYLASWVYTIILYVQVVPGESLLLEKCSVSVEGEDCAEAVLQLPRQASQPKSFVKSSTFFCEVY